MYDMLTLRLYVIEPIYIFFMFITHKQAAAAMDITSILPPSSLYFVVINLSQKYEYCMNELLNVIIVL